MKKIIRGKGRGLAKLANAALAAAVEARAAKDAYEIARAEAQGAVKAAYPDLARGDVLVFENGRIEGSDTIERTLVTSQFNYTIEKLYDSPVAAIEDLVKSGVLKFDLAATRKVFGASMVLEDRQAGGPPKFVPASATDEQQQEAVNQ